MSFALVLAATAWLAIIAPRDHTRDASGRYLDVRAALAVVERLAPPPPRESVTLAFAARPDGAGPGGGPLTSTFELDPLERYPTRSRRRRPSSRPFRRASPRRRSARPPPRISAAVSCTGTQFPRRRVEGAFLRAARGGGRAPRVYGASRTPSFRT